MVEIRTMSVGEADAVAVLAHQLGYEASPGAVREWLANMDHRRIALVAIADGELVGWIQAHDRDLLQYPRVMEIGGLIVDTEIRRGGVGKQLVDAAIEWGRDRGHTEVFVRSNAVRSDAHAFYEGLGFSRWKTSHTFVLEVP